MIKTIIKEKLYLDSVLSMSVGREIKKLDGVNSATVVMGTDLNKTVLAEMGGLTPEAEAATPNTLIISLDVDSDDGIEDVVLKKLDELMAGDDKKGSGDEKKEYKNLDMAFADNKDTNLVIVSVAGEFAAEESRKALENNANVFIFSDNVPLEDEIELKTMAKEKGLLVMGPGCGTSVIGGISIGMMSKVARGRIGIVAASGSGLQEVAVIIDRLGEGVSQAIGTGGRDLSKDVGGITMMQGIDYLDQDPDTDVIVLVSKPPHPETAKKIYDRIAVCTKPTVIYFLGGNRAEIEACGAFSAESLENAAETAVALKRGTQIHNNDFFEKNQANFAVLADKEAAKLSADQKYLRGLFCGGTHSEEAVLILKNMVSNLHSNISFGGAKLLDSPLQSVGNSLVDMGDEVFTRGKPHPVIDPSVMFDRMIEDGTCGETAVLLFDLLLGHGCCADPVDILHDALVEVRKKSAEAGKYVCIICDLCGTEKEPQDYAAQKARLEELGVHVFFSNAQAAIFAGMVIERGAGNGTK